MGCHGYRPSGSASEQPMNSEKCEKWPAALRRRDPKDPRHEYHHHHHRPRRKRLSLAARFLLISCLIAVSSSYDEPKEECTAPRLVNFNVNRLSRFTPTVSPRDIPQLGDGIRSTEASGIFFDSLDSDGDGAIEPEEVAMFLQNEIGGKQFDTQIAVDKEVGTIMERLDKNQNNGLEMSDMLDYWITLESLLTAEEVSEWIVYSVQLPSSVGKIFLENGITGYDFLEIVDNGGEVLKNELGIDKVSFRNKIVRQMQARMLGIGSSPGTPQKFTYRLESCKAITLSWERSVARVFPVHSYRIQRRAINLFGNESSNEDSIPNSNNFDSASTSGWKTVYVGGENEFVDSGLETGHNYMYRIQAWNSVGRSGWETIDLSHALKKQRCSTKPSQQKFVTERGISSPPEVETQWEWMSTPKRVLWGTTAAIQFMYHSVRFVLALFALLAGLMRFRRATASSSASATTILPFPWIWNAINYISLKVFGRELIPRTMLGDKEALRRQEKMHDERIMATGLRGYNRLRKKAESEDAGKDRSDPNNTDRRVAFNIKKYKSTGDILSSTNSFGPPREVVVPRVVPREVGTPNKFAWMRKRNGNVSFGRNSSDVSEAASLSPTLRSRGSNMSKSDHPSVGIARKLSDVDDNKKCSECDKGFKIGKRYKHHCSRCMATFCHKHGRTTHNNFTSCKIPGDCMCNSCLKVLASRTPLSERSRHSS